MTSARDVVPFGVDTSTVCSHSGAPGGTRFWKNDFPSAPSGNRCSIAGRPAGRAQDRLGDGEVVADEVELGRAEAREEDLVRVRDLDTATRHLDGLAGRSAAWARHDDRLARGGSLGRPQRRRPFPGRVRPSARSGRCRRSTSTVTRTITTP